MNKILSAIPHFLILILIASSISYAKDAKDLKAARARFSAQAFTCSLAGTDIIFEPATQQLDTEYLTIETLEHRGVEFLLKGGHGVGVLEAWMAGRKTASTFYSTGREPAETDSLRLMVTAPDGSELEAQCYEVDSRIHE